MNHNTVLRVEGYAKQFCLHEQNKIIPSSYDVNFEVNSAHLTALTGPTGAGKSTVLKGIYRTYLPSNGRIFYKTKLGDLIDLASADEHTILELRKNEIGFVTQFLHVLPRQSTEDVVAQPLVNQGWAIEKAREVAREMLSSMKLPERLWCISPATFSGGEKQRVNLARGFVTRPRLLLLDEPTASLDPNTADRVVGLIEQLKSKGVAILAIFHDPELVQRIADQVVVLKIPSNNEIPLEKIA
ncbi:MAG: phosphonate C-P lyase system protein PhnL [Candidatus Thiodiazotropha sp. LLP2]